MSAAAGRPRRAVKNVPALRGYQQEAVDAIVDGQVGGGRGQFRAACGTGKTFVAVEAARRLCATGLVVKACPSLPLLAQTLSVWTAVGRAGLVLAVCSDETLTDTALQVADLACPVTTRSGEITDWIRGSPSNRMRLILVTHASAGLVGDGLKGAGAIADLLVIDEAHHTAGWPGKHRALVHDDERLPARRRLYMTATPRVLAAKRRADGSREDVLSMDDTAVFGPVHYSYPFARAIAERWLDDYRVVVIGVTSTEALTILRRADDRGVVDAYDAPLRTAVVQTALVRAAVEFGLRRVLVFTPRVAQSQEFIRTLPRTLAAVADDDRPKGRLTVGHVDGTQTTRQRHIHLANLADPPDEGWTVVSNSRCLSEGVDVPAVDGVVFTWPKESEADVIQAIGRALRRNPSGTGIATVLVPVLVPDDPGDTTRNLTADLTEWATLLQVLRALRAHDSEFAAALDTQRARLSTGAATLPARVIMRLPDGYATEELLRQVTVRVLEETTSDWLVGYGALTAFQAEHGHLKIPGAQRYQGVRLARWVAHQRAEYQARRLPDDRVQLLNDIRFDWNPMQRAWQRSIAAARTFHAEHGHLTVPVGYTVDGLDLAQWVRQQRFFHRENTLCAERVAALTELGIDWSIQRPSWEECFAMVKAFHDTHGHIRVPRGLTVEGTDVYDWLCRRRTDYKLHDLSAERIQKLEALGMQWSSWEVAWERNLATAAAFYQREGHLRPPQNHREGGINLSSWIRRLRGERNNAKLTEARITALDAVGMHWQVDTGQTGMHQAAQDTTRPTGQQGHPMTTSTRPLPHRRCTCEV